MAQTVVFGQYDERDLAINANWVWSQIKVAFNGSQTSLAMWIGYHYWGSVGLFSKKTYKDVGKFIVAAIGSFSNDQAIQ